MRICKVIGVARIGVLDKRVDDAFECLEKGDFERFVKDICWVADVHYGWHKDIVMRRVEKHLDEKMFAFVVSKKKQGDVSGR
jgi:hypothetical protein